MGIPLLLVATATHWLGTARIIRPLARAGFEVHLLAPHDSLAEKSRYLTSVRHLPPDTNPRQWVASLTAATRARPPRLVVPCDDMALRLLQMLVLSPPYDMPSALHLELAALIRESLGEPHGYRASIDKTLLPTAAEGMGVRVAPYAHVASISEAEAFASAHAYPLVLKRRHSSAGDGVAICSDAASLPTAFAELVRTAGLDLEGEGTSLLAQAYVPGPVMFYPAAAWKGELLTGYAAEKLLGNPEPKGPATVNRYHRSPMLRELAVRLARGFGISGFFSLECIVSDRDGLPYLLEINRRIVPSNHRGSAFDVDHCVALHAALVGVASTTRADFAEGEEHIGVHFPQEWLRDPASPWLRRHPVDVPWDEPELIAAMLALRHHS